MKKLSQLFTTSFRIGVMVRVCFGRGLKDEKTECFLFFIVNDGRPRRLVRPPRIPQGGAFPAVLSPSLHAR